MPLESVTLKVLYLFPSPTPSGRAKGVTESLYQIYCLACQSGYISSPQMGAATVWGLRKCGLPEIILCFPSNHVLCSVVQLVVFCAASISNSNLVDRKTNVRAVLLRSNCLDERVDCVWRCLPTNRQLVSYLRLISI